MDIRFTVNNTNYQLTSNKLNIFLKTVTEVKSGPNEGNESFTEEKSFRTSLQALEFVLNTNINDSECKTFTELAKYHRETLDRLNEIADEYKLKE